MEEETRYMIFLSNTLKRATKDTIEFVAVMLFSGTGMRHLHWTVGLPVEEDVVGDLGEMDKETAMSHLMTFVQHAGEIRLKNMGPIDWFDGAIRYAWEYLETTGQFKRLEYEGIALALFVGLNHEQALTFSEDGSVFTRKTLHGDMAARGQELFLELLYNNPEVLKISYLFSTRPLPCSEQVTGTLMRFERDSWKADGPLLASNICLVLDYARAFTDREGRIPWNEIKHYQVMVYMLVDGEESLFIKKQIRPRGYAPTNSRNYVLAKGDFHLVEL